MKKLSLVFLLTLSTVHGIAQFSISLQSSLNGPKALYLDAVNSFMYPNEKSYCLSPQVDLNIRWKRLALQIGGAYYSQSFKLRSDITWFSPYDPTYGPLSYHKNVAYQESHILIGRSQDFLNGKLRLSLSAGSFLLKQVAGKESFLGVYAYNYVPSFGLVKAEALFNPRIPGLMAQIDLGYSFHPRWFVHVNLNWRGLLDYMSLEELNSGWGRYENPRPILNRNFVNLGLGISYTLLKGKEKEKEQVKKARAKTKGTHALGLQGGYSIQDVQGSAFLQFIAYRKSSSWGLTYDYLRGKHLYLGTGIQYQQRGYSGVYEDFSKFPYVYDAEVKKFYNYLAMPLRIGFKTGGKAYWHLGAGAVPALLLKAYSLNEELGASGQLVGLREVDEKPFLRSMDWAVMLETGMVLPLRKGFSLQSTLNWQHSLSNFYKPEYASFGQSLRHRSLGLQLGLQYNLAPEK